MNVVLCSNSDAMRVAFARNYSAQTAGCADQSPMKQVAEPQLQGDDTHQGHQVGGITVSRALQTSPEFDRIDVAEILTNGRLEEGFELPLVRVNRNHVTTRGGGLRSPGQNVVRYEPDQSAPH